MKVSTLRPILTAASLALLAPFAACADAPVTQDQIEDNGELKPRAGLGQVAMATHTRPVSQTAARMSAVLAAQASGPLQDAAVFPAETGVVHLHLRADGLSEARPVTVRWTHDGVAVAFPSELSASGAMSLTSSMPILPEQAGKWRVEVLAAAEDERTAPILFEREFEVIAPVLPADAL